MNLQKLETIPCNIAAIGPGISNVTFTLPDEEVHSFVLMLTGLAGLFKSVSFKQKCDIDAVHMRIEQQKAEVEQYQQEYENAVCAMYAEFYKREQDSRLAFSLTVLKIKNKYPNSSYDIVKNCLTKNKLLKKTGFYKNRHKID